MSRILISWEAYKEDFETKIWMNDVKREKKILHSGPTFSLHKDFPYDYEKHLLLSAPKNAEDQEFSKLLVKELNECFPKHNIEGRNINIKDPLDIAEIFKISNNLLNEYRHDEIDVFISTGFPNMRVAWFLTQPNYKKNLILFQIREAKYSPDGKPQKLNVNIESFNPNALNILNEVADQPLAPGKIFYSKSIAPVYKKAELVAATKNVGCLILGDNGTGKENLASYIHKKSERAKKSFVVVNCAAFTDELLRSELFGHEKGSFTGAHEQRKGAFEMANAGTIFLDEIGDISPKMQVSLLRVMEEKKIQRIGSVKEIDIDVRVIAATNKNLEELCEKEIFRWDLFFRLERTTIQLPSLHDWTKVEIKNLINHFNTLYLSEFPNRTEKLKFGKEVIDRLTKYKYKGNVRELQNLIISLYTFCDKEITLDDLPERIRIERINPTTKDEIERAVISKEFYRQNQNIVKTANALKMHRDTVARKVLKYGLK